MKASALSAILAILAISIVPAPAAVPAAAPANPKATPRTRVVFEYLAGLEGRKDRRVVSGQFTDYGTNADLKLLEEAHELQPEDGRRPIGEAIAAAIRDFRPSAHTERLEYMDLVAVKECTDPAFLPEKYRAIAPEALEARLAVLRVRIAQ